MKEKKQAAVSNEQIIAAILSNNTIEAAAKACSISTRAVYDRMHSDDFQAAYMAAKNDILRTSVYNLNSHVAAAIDTMAEIMRDTGNSPSIRLQAAQSILNNAGRLSERLDKEEQTYKNFTDPGTVGLRKLLNEQLNDSDLYFPESCKKHIEEGII